MSEWMKQWGRGCVEFEKGFSTCRKLLKQVNIKAKYLESVPINANTDFLFYFCTIGKLVNAFDIAKWHSFVSAHFYLLLLILSVTTWMQSCCPILGIEVRMFTKSPYFRFSPGSYSPLSASESLPASKKPHYFYLATDISFITLVVLLSFEQRGWCGLYYKTAKS